MSNIFKAPKHGALQVLKGTLRESWENDSTAYAVASSAPAEKLDGNFCGTDSKSMPSFSQLLGESPRNFYVKG